MRCPTDPHAKARRGEKRAQPRDDDEKPDAELRGIAGYSAKRDEFRRDIAWAMLDVLMFGTRRAAEECTTREGATTRQQSKRLRMDEAR